MCKTLSHNNKVIVASAGSRKTTCIVEEALFLTNKNVLITTYTNENLEQIHSYIIQKNGCIPQNITILSWYSFLLQDGVRPYQKSVTQKGRVNSIIFKDIPIQLQRIKKSNIDKYFFTEGNDIFRDRVSDFVCYVDDRSSGAVINRLQRIYDYIFIDEVQDFAGYDLNFLEKLFNSSINIVAVGDPRQATLSTNNSLKNKKYKKTFIFDWIARKQTEGLVVIEERNECYRCNQHICDFGDSLFPSLPKTISKNTDITGHDGIFYLEKKDVIAYVNQYKPTILRYSKKTDTMNLKAVNIGLSKGRTYERVVVFPTKPMLIYLNTNDISKAGDISKLYVAVTRAKYSVAFVKK
ncbi:MAG TPA: UvrD-helicase domain-containing protein [Candidatus Paceibacterota bacterium]|nr:UvrD-helicase domain-containing protein [Candidatus Paceibacterota bacterium]HPT40008.1 UvrD-helicase domain-containing protein [Candidatus Paceibacterota bacterium]